MIRKKFVQRGKNLDHDVDRFLILCLNVCELLDGIRVAHVEERVADIGL